MSGRIYRGSHVAGVSLRLLLCPLSGVEACSGTCEDPGIWPTLAGVSAPLVSPM